MEFWTAVAVLRRRWYIVVPGLLLTLLAAGLLASQVKPTFQAFGKMVILQKPVASDQSSSTTPTTALAPQSTTTVDPASDNPMAQLSRVQFANLISEVAADGSFKDDLMAAGGSSTYEVKPPFGDTSVLALSASAESRVAALESYRTLVKTLQSTILTQQEGVGALGRTPYQGYESISPTDAFPQGGARTKALLLAATAGLILTLGAAFAFDSLMASRDRKKQVLPTGQVTLLPNPRSPLDELTMIEDPDHPDDPDIKGSAGGPMRW